MPGEVSKKLCNLARATPGSATGTPPFHRGYPALFHGWPGLEAWVTRALGYGQGLALLVHPSQDLAGCTAYLYLSTFPGFSFCFFVFFFHAVFNDFIRVTLCTGEFRL